jgi:hypothetical protein
VNTHITQSRRATASRISRRGQRLVAGAIVLAAAAGAPAAAPAPAQAAVTGPEVLEQQLEELVRQRLGGLESHFQILRQATGDVKPGDTVGVEIVDKVDRGAGQAVLQSERKKVNLARQGFSSLAGVEIQSPRWSARVSAGDLARGLSSAQAAVVGSLTGPASSFLLAPPVVQQGAGSPPLTRFVRLTFTPRVDLPAVRDLVKPLDGRLDLLDTDIELDGATQQQIDQLLAVDPDPVQVDNLHVDLPVPVLPLPVPNLLVACENGANANRLKISCQRGKGDWTMVVAPAGIGISSTAESVQASLDRVRLAADKLRRLAGLVFEDLAAATAPINRAINAVPRAKVFLFTEHENLNDLTVIQRGRFENDTEAEDTISAMMLFGLPGSRWRAFENQDFRGDHLDIVVPSGKFVVEAPELHVNAPAGTTNRSDVKRKSWGNLFSSLQRRSVGPETIEP